MHDKYVKLTYTNCRGESLEFTKSFPLFLQHVSGLDSVPTSYSSTKATNQDGVTLSNGTSGPRPISIYGAIKGANKTDIYNLRDKILRVFTPKTKGTIKYEYGNRVKIIECYVENGAKFNNNNNVWKVQNFIIDLICENPYLEDEFKVGEHITTWIGGLRFKFTLPFKLKQKGPTKKNIINNGHVATPLEIIFKGPAVNPMILNHRTSEFIRVKKTLTSDDTLYINTQFGNKTVEVERHGTRENAFHFIDLNSTFFSLEVGDNFIEYKTESLEPQSVEIKYKNLYLGL